MIGERQSNGIIAAQQQNYGPHFQAINPRLRGLGLQDLYARGDQEAGRPGRNRRATFATIRTRRLRASKRLGASFVLRGLISSQATGIR